MWQETQSVVFVCAAGSVLDFADGGQVAQPVGRGQRLMTLSAHAVVMHCRFLAPRDVVRVVAGDAGHFAFEEAARFAEAVGGMGDLEIVTVGAAGGVIEEDHEIEWLAASIADGN